MDQPHPTARAVSGTAAQGYLAAAGDALLLATGRAVPAVFSREDGAFRYFHLQREGRNGGCDMTAIDDHFFNNRGMFATVDGANHGRCGRQVAAHPELVFSAAGDRLSAVDRKHLLVEKEVTDRKGQKMTVKAMAPSSWSVTLPHGADASLIVAGDKVVAGGRNKVSVVDIDGRKTVWTADVSGIAYGLAAAGGRLYVSTDQGVIHCFGRDAGSDPAVIESNSQPITNAVDSRYAAAAEEIIRRSGVTEGYCLDLACGDGRLAMELAKRTNLQIYAVDSDPEKVQAARQMLDAVGLYGVRVTVHQADPAKVGYPDYFADLIVSGRAVAEGASVIPGEAMARMQRPYGGMACLVLADGITQSARGPLEGAGNWTHQYTNAANTLCSDDTLVRGPLEMLWFRDTDFVMPDRHGKGPAPLVEGGRMFVEGINGVRAVNAYNGRTLWEYSIPGILASYHKSAPGVAVTGSNICTDGERVYLRVRNQCLCLDVETGAATPHNSS
jgi:outer membrane protein assembly factor BamB